MTNILIPNVHIDIADKALFESYKLEPAVTGFNEQSLYFIKKELLLWGNGHYYNLSGHDIVCNHSLVSFTINGISSGLLHRSVGSSIIFEIPDNVSDVDNTSANVVLSIESVFGESVLPDKIEVDGSIVFTNTAERFVTRQTAQIVPTPINVTISGTISSLQKMHDIKVFYGRNDDGTYMSEWEKSVEFVFRRASFYTTVGPDVMPSNINSTLGMSRFLYEPSEETTLGPLTYTLQKFTIIMPVAVVGDASDLKGIYDSNRLNYWNGNSGAYFVERSEIGGKDYYIYMIRGASTVRNFVQIV